MGEKLPSAKESHPNKKNKPRCYHCRKKLGHIILPPCQCGFTFCLQHQSKHSHNCPCDTLDEKRENIRSNNPPVVPTTLTKF